MSETDSDFLQSGEVLLDIARSEYQNEFNRTSVLDTKIGITLPIVATYFFLIIQFESIRKVFLCEVNSKNILTVIWSVCTPLFFLSAIIVGAISLLLLLYVITTHSYQTIDPSCFNCNDKMSLPPKIFSGVMVTYYIRATTHNRETNDKRVTLYQRGWITAIISLALFVIYIFLST